MTGLNLNMRRNESNDDVCESPLAQGQGKEIVRRINQIDDVVEDLTDDSKFKPLNLQVRTLTSIRCGQPDFANHPRVGGVNVKCFFLLCSHGLVSSKIRGSGVC